MYTNLGEYEAALKYYEEALSNAKETANRKGAASILVNISRVYSDSGRKQEALNSCTKAFAIFKDIGDRYGEGAVLNNMGMLYSALGEKKKALDYFDQALSIRNSIGDKSGEAYTLSAIGTTYADLGEKQKAIGYFTKALPISRAVKNKQIEAITLINLSGVFRTENPRLAVLFSKKSVFNHQQLREGIQGLDTEIQKSYLRRMQIPYQFLIEMLLSQNRMPEAFQAINIVRNQETFDVTASPQRQLYSLTFTPHEEKISKSYEDAADKVGNIGGIIELFKRKLGSRRPSLEEIKELQQLELKLKTAGDEFLAVIKQAEAEFLKPASKDDVLLETKDSVQMQTTIRNLADETGEKVAAVYTVFTKEKFIEIIVTANKISSVFTVIKGADLHEKAKEFADNIKTLNSENQPKIDVTVQAKELYNIIFRPVESELPKDITTIMWALDDTLRYVPINALHDGENYLVHRKVNNVLFTRSDSERFTRSLKPVWRATGFASSQPQKNVKNLGIGYDFGRLIAVEPEMRGIFKQKGSNEGIIEGDILENQGFTKDSMISALKKKNPVVHISSHFSIKPGDITRSFLLLGDGTAFPLSEMRKEKNLFENVDLLTLSACNTAVNEPGSEGREVDGFAELAQRLGAASVLGTLWSVNDCSTSEFMKFFYKNKVNLKMTKAEALRQAQLSLLDGRVKINNEACTTNKSGDDPLPTKPKSIKNFKSYRVNPSNPFEHPYYWSPFVLYGNWK